MMTAPDRWPSETILSGIFLSARSITRGASMYAAWMRPAMSDSLISGQPLYLPYSKRPAFAPGCDARATHATGSVRLQLTGRPPTTRGPRAADAGATAPNGNAAAAPAMRKDLRASLNRIDARL